ncbi:hypothetical protein NH448_13895 [Halomonas sp. OfavH-34-E]|nr:hypothetical protein [Halomonas sp. OfavH-34-E]
MAALRMDQFISDAAAALASFPIQRFVHNPCLAPSPPSTAGSGLRLPAVDGTLWCR